MQRFGRIGALTGTTGGDAVAQADDVPTTPNRRRGPHRLAIPPYVAVVVAVALVAGGAMRAWFLTHHPINSDEAVAGLIARQILHGHFSAFFWGQSFGGVEPYVVALVFAVFGQNSVSLGLAPALLSAVAAVLVWRIALRLVHARSIAALAGALVWVAPLAAVYQSTFEGGYRGVTLVCGLAMWLLALRILDGHRRLKEFAVLGLVVGVGWWSLPEIVYFALPAALLLVGAVARSGESRRKWATRIGVAVVSFCVGALPWIWDNVQSGFASIDAGSFPGSNAPLNPGYVGRLEDFFRYSLPLQLDLRRLSDGSWLTGSAGSSWDHRLLLVVVVIATIGVIAVSLVLCLRRGGRSLVAGVALMAFPFLVAAQPATWFWEDGRYTVYFGALVALVVAVGTEEVALLTERATVRGQPINARSTAPIAFSVLTLICTVLSIVSFHQSFGVSVSSFATNWGNPDRPSQRSAVALERLGVRSGYADYWIAYKLDFVSGGALELSVAGTDPDRWKQLDRAVRTSPDAAWIFVPSIAAAGPQFGFTPLLAGPGGLSERAAVSRLQRLGIRFRVVHGGVFDVVIPNGSVSPQRP
jgi:hypothetical protein